MNILRMLSLRDTNHPDKLIDIVAGIADGSSEDHKHIVHVQHGHDLVGRRLVAGHGLADQRYVRVVPSVVVDEGCAVAHARYL